jgi:hypothetical protein
MLSLRCFNYINCFSYIEIHFTFFVLHYGLDDQGVGFRVPVGQEFSLFHVVETGSGPHLTSYQMGTGGSFPGGKAAGA